MEGKGLRNSTDPLLLKLVMKIKPITFQDSDFLDGLHPAMCEQDGEGHWQPTVSNEDFAGVRFLTEARASSLLEDCLSICDASGGRGKWKDRAMLSAEPFRPDWLRRQFLLNHVQPKDPILWLTDSGACMGLLIESDVLLRNFDGIYDSSGDQFLLPPSMRWLIYEYHHGETWFLHLR